MDGTLFPQAYPMPRTEISPPGQPGMVELEPSFAFTLKIRLNPGSLQMSE
jgi:hypothetical protein